MGKGRLRVAPAEGLVEQVVERQRRQPLLAADDVRHLHQMVVDNVGQVVCGQGVGRLVEHLVVECRGIHLHVAADQVLHLDEPVFGHLEADDPLVSAVDARTHLLGRQGQRRSQVFAHGVVVGKGLATGFGLLAQLVELLGRIEGVVGPAGIDQLQGIFQIDFAPLALAVGGVRAADTDAFVNLDAAPTQRLHDVLLSTRNEPLRVGILDAEDHRAAVLACEEVVVQCGADAADVQRSGGTGCKAHPNGSGHDCVYFYVFVCSFSLAKRCLTAAGEGVCVFSRYCGVKFRPVSG